MVYLPSNFVSSVAPFFCHLYSCPHTMDTSKSASTVVSLSDERKEETLSDKHEFGQLDTAGLPAKYRGTAADQRDMSILGKKQVLRVCYTHMAIISLATR